MNHTKHLSFLFPVPGEFFSSSVKVTKPFEIKVSYTLDYRGVVSIEGYTVTPGMCQYIIKWSELEEQLLKAAENNSKQYRVPEAISYNGIRPEGKDPYEDIHEQWEQEVKEAQGWY